VSRFSKQVWVLGFGSGLVLVAGGCPDGAGKSGEPAAPAPVVASPDTAPAAPPTAAMTCRPEPARPVTVEPGRSIHCAIDVGSRNVKLVVGSVLDGQPASLQNERQCRVRLQLADRTFDAKTGTPRALSPADQTALATLFRAYRKQCETDGGRLHGAVATEWARRAPNGQEVKRHLEEETGVRMDVLDRAAEVRYGYLAATRGLRGRMVLDFGSRSLQLAFWPRGVPAPEGVSAQLGIDEAGDRFFAPAAARTYAEGRKALEPVLRAALAPVLTSARASLKKKTLAPELVSLGENGDLALALAGKLWSGSPARPVTESGYAAAVKSWSMQSDPRYGKVSAVLTAAPVRTIERALEQNPILFDELRSTTLKRVYGNKLLVFPVLARLLEQELGITTIVLVPQEMADGFLIDRLGSGEGAVDAGPQRQVGP
jgi:hypothetical protein